MRMMGQCLTLFACSQGLGTGVGRGPGPLKIKAAQLTCNINDLTYKK